MAKGNVIDLAAARAAFAEEPENPAKVAVLFLPSGIELVGLTKFGTVGYEVANPMIIQTGQTAEGRQTINLVPFQLGYSNAFMDGVLIPVGVVATYAVAGTEFKGSYETAVARYRGMLSGIILPNQGLKPVSN